jgi:hypothetical protein
MATIRGRFLFGVVAGLLGLVPAGCSSIGPGTVTRDRVDYANASSDSWKDQMLLNIVRLRYGDAPTFMDLSSVISSYTIGAQLSAGATTNFGAPGNPTTGTVGVGGAYADRPTISYTPLTGQKFAQSLLEPIPPAAIFSLIQSGYPADMVIPATVSALNGVYNRTVQGGIRRPSDPLFYPLIETIRRTQLSRAISLRSEKRGDKQVAIVVFASRLDPQVQRDIEFVRKTLNLKLENNEIVLTQGAVQSSPNELAVFSRSMIQIMQAISSDIEVPAEDVSDGRTYANAAVGPDASPFDLPQIAIHSGPIPPGDAFTAVNYRGSWYWISDHDLKSKASLTFLLLFFALAETGVVPEAPVLTIPVQ